MYKSILRRLFRSESVAERGSEIQQMRISLDECTLRFLTLVHNIGIEEKIALANQSCIPDEVLVDFAHDAEADVRYAVAENIHAPVTLLLNLANDSNTYVAERAMRTLVWVFYVRASYEDILIKEIQLTQQDVLDATARKNSAFISSPTMSESDMFEKILATEQQYHDADSLNWLIKVAEHAGTPAGVLQRLAGHPHPDVRIAVSDNAAAPIEILRRLANDESLDVRYALAENHNVDQTILLILMSDGNPFISQRAQKTLLRLRRGVMVRGDFPENRNMRARK